MMRTCNEYGMFSYSDWDGSLKAPLADVGLDDVFGMKDKQAQIESANYKTPWSEKRKEYKTILGDEKLCEDIWNNIEKLGTMFIWQMLLCF